MYSDLVLKVERCFHTMDMSVANSGSFTKLYCLDELKQGFKITSPEFSPIVVEDSNDKFVTLRWNRVSYKVPLDTEVTTEWVQRDNPYLSVDEICYKFYFTKENLSNRVVECTTKVSDIHGRYGTYNTSLYREAKEMALWYIKRLLDLNWVSFYPIYAYYRAIDDWHTGEIKRFDEFHSIMQEGIKLGCLMEDDDLGWYFFSIVVNANEDKVWAGHNKTYTDLVKKSAESGVEEAKKIWEEYGRDNMLYERPVWKPTIKDYILEIESSENTFDFSDGKNGSITETYSYTLDELKPGMIIHHNPNYPPLKVLNALQTSVELECEGEKYRVAVNKNQTYTKMADVKNNYYNDMLYRLKYRVRTEDEVNDEI